MTTKAESAGAGLRSILIATAVAGILGYAIQLLAPRLIADDAGYVTFSVYWSTLYLFVATLSGVQQEITRAARPVVDEPPSRTLVEFTAVCVGVIVAAVAVFTWLFGATLLPGDTLALAACLVLGVIGYLLVAVLSGVLYGLRLWNAVAWISVVDVALRAALVLGGLALGWSAPAIALAISLPFGLAFLAVWLPLRRRVVGGFRVDAGLRRLLAQAGGTVVAAAAMGLIMNGMPMLLGVTSRHVEAGALAGLILAITVTRAPIVVPLLALQSYLISIMRDSAGVVRARVLRVTGLAFIGVLVLAGAAALFGPWVIEVISGGRYAIGGSMMAAITAGAGLVAMMCITGPALIAERRHVPYTAGWIVAAVLTLVCLQLPAAWQVTVPLAMILPPAVGVMVHLVAVWRGVPQRSGPAAGRRSPA